MTETTVVLALYSAAGACEAAAVVITAVDIRCRADIAREYFGAVAETSDLRTAKRQSTAAAHGTISYDQLERLAKPLSAALTGRALIVAAALLLAGIVLGTIANALNT